MDVILLSGTLWVRHPTLEFWGYRDLGGKFSWEYSFRSYLHPGGAAGRTSGTGTPSGSAVGSIPTVSALCLTTGCSSVRSCAAHRAAHGAPTGRILTWSVGVRG